MCVVVRPGEGMMVAVFSCHSVSTCQYGLIVVVVFVFLALCARG